jgi:seryl-tRNA synthetase
MDNEKLLELKEKIDTAKTKVSELTGQKNALMKQLRDEWDCKSTEEGDKKISQMLKEIQNLSEKIDAGVKELEEKYGIES